MTYKVSAIFFSLQIVKVVALLIWPGLFSFQITDQRRLVSKDKLLERDNYLTSVSL